MIIAIIRYYFISVLILTAQIAAAQTPGANIARQEPSSAALNPNISQPYSPITGKQRVRWFLLSSVGPQSLTAGLFSAGIGTARDKPVEYGSSWPGYGKRYGMRLTGVATGNAIEAGIGALWGEDPRYFRAEGQPLGSRVKNILVMTVAARRRDGRTAPAYARFIATPGNNFLSNTWRADSESTVNAALVRTAVGFAGRAASNAFQEFWPDIKHHVLRMK